MIRHIHILLLCCLLVSTALFSQNLNIIERSTMTFPGQQLANIWGYTAGGNEYALVGAANGMIVVNVTNPDNPTQIVQIPGPASSWREIKTYSHYAYVVSEGGGQIQIVNLTNLPNNNLAYHSVNGGSGLTSGHALHIDETTGYLYVYGSNLNGGRAQVFNLNADPYNPTYSGFVNFVGYVHDGFVDNDLLYAGHIYAGQFSIVNMTNKSNPVLLGTQSTPGAFTHNTWKSGNTLFTTDEVNYSFLTAYDVSDPGDITFLDKIQVTPGSGSIVHNTHVIDDYAVTSWYKDGVAIIDGSRPANLVKVGLFDTYPNGSGSGFDGCWGVHPYFPSGNIVASNIKVQGTSDGQLWVLTPTYTRGCYLEGQVTAAASGQPLTGATIEIQNTANFEYADATGEYKMGQVESGVFTVLVNYPGYYQYSGQVTLSNGVLTTLNVALIQIIKSPLPVEFVRFDARADGQKALLSWETASETGNAGFEIQQSAGNTQQWEVLGFVPAKGDGTSPARYEFATPDLSPGYYTFRLRQLDLDGRHTFSPARQVTIFASSLQLSVSPNPVDDLCRLRIQSARPAKIEVEILDALGQATGLPLQVEVDAEADIPLSLGHLPAGIYYILLRSGQERVRKPVVKN